MTTTTTTFWRNKCQTFFRSILLYPRHTGSTCVEREYDSDDDYDEDDVYGDADGDVEWNGVIEADHAARIIATLLSRR